MHRRVGSLILPPIASPWQHPFSDRSLPSPLSSRIPTASLSSALSRSAPLTIHSSFRQNNDHSVLWSSYSGPFLWSTHLIPTRCILSRITRHALLSHRRVGSLSLLALLLKSCIDLILLSHILSRIARRPVGAVAGLLFLAHHGVWLSTELILLSPA
jgi:hypothetical protein